MSQSPDQASPDPDQLVGMLLAVLGRIRDVLDRQAEALQLPPRQAMALLHLNGPTSMRQLAGCLRCDASNVTGLADRLEMAGLVERSPGPGDRRVKWLVLTDRGRGLREQLRAQLSAADCAFAVLDDPQRQHLANRFPGCSPARASPRTSFEGHSGRREPSGKPGRLTSGPNKASLVSTAWALVCRWLDWAPVRRGCRGKQE